MPSSLSLSGVTMVVKFIALLLMLLDGWASVATKNEPFVGVNIRRTPKDLPSATQVALLLNSHKIRHVRLYDTDQAILTALTHTPIRVMISIPNNQLPTLAKSSRAAEIWVSRCIKPFYPATTITAIGVGLDIFTTPNTPAHLVPAMKNLYSALAKEKLEKSIKLSTSISSSVLINPFPPSKAMFNESFRSIVIPLLNFLNSTDSFIMHRVSPYNDYVNSNGAIPLDFALFRPIQKANQAVDSSSHLRYSNIFDVCIDAVYYAMAKMNHSSIPVVVSETGWPSRANPREKAATMENAELYNSNMIRHVLGRFGTPNNPRIVINTFIYELYEDDGDDAGRNWGLFNSDGEPVYDISFAKGRRADKGKFCVAKPGSDNGLLQQALDWACGPGEADCSRLMDDGDCFLPNNVAAHASYAFNSHYHNAGMTPISCDFNGLAIISTADPSHGQCTFAGSNGITANSSPNATVQSTNYLSTRSSDASSSGTSTADSMSLVGTLMWISIFL